MIKINEQDLIIQKMKIKLKKIEQDYNILKNNFILLKNKNEENEKNIKTMTKKELKLMQVLFLIKERGIDINSFLNEVNQISFNENVKELVINSIRDDDSNYNGNGINDMSGITVYFPDKVKMNNIMESKWAKNVPKLDFGYVPEYSSDSDSLPQNNNNYNNTLIEDLNYYFPKLNKYQNSA